MDLNGGMQPAAELPGADLRKAHVTGIGVLFCVECGGMVTEAKPALRLPVPGGAVTVHETCA